MSNQVNILAAILAEHGATLPVGPVLPALEAALSTAGAAVLQAPPGAGKTTLVPLALLQAPWAAGGRLVVIEPRRLAARTAALRMSCLLGEPVGGTVGYRVRHDSRVSAATRIEVVTEGIFLRRLQDDPGLSGVAAVVFDEIHERHLDSDLALALCLEARAALREDLRLLAMSATLDGAPIAALLGDAPMITSEGRNFPVETIYVPQPDARRPEAAAVAAVRRALCDTDGDLLVFLPGAGEIRRTLTLLHASLTDAPVGPGPGPRPGPQGVDCAKRVDGARGVDGAKDVDGANGSAIDVLPLYGDLGFEQQERALRPSAPGRRRVVLATSIAETSLTIPGVRTVIDIGLMRVPRFDPRTGMTRLETVKVSQASADQRRGRAGRTAPGVCYRLWPEPVQRALLPFTPAEILAADLAPLALELAVWGTGDADTLAWLDPPPPAALAQARDLLHRLGALDSAGAITDHGRAMAELGAHPRLAHMMLRGRSLGHGRLACLVAAVLGERDVVRSEGRGDGRDADLRRRIELVIGAGGTGTGAGGASARSAGADPVAVRQCLASAAQWRRQLGLHGPTGSGPKGNRSRREEGNGDSERGGTYVIPMSVMNDSLPLGVAGSRRPSGDAVPRHPQPKAEGPLETGYKGNGSNSRLVGISERDGAAGNTRDGAAGSERGGSREDLSALGELVALAYPDRIAQRRPGGRGQFRLAGGGGATVAPEDALAGMDWLAVAALDGDRRDARIFLAAPLTLGEIEQAFADAITWTDEVAWDRRARTVIARRRRCLGALVLEEQPLTTLDPARLAAAVLAGVRCEGLTALAWTDDLTRWRQRVMFARRLEGAEAGWPDLGDDALLAGLEHWLSPFVDRRAAGGRFDTIDLASALTALLPWALRQRLETLAPTHWVVPSGSRVRIDYESGEEPVLAVRLQEMFGSTVTPTVGDGRVPVLLHLLSPAQRPVQVTRDLISFWRTGYAAVRADLRGRYPRHSWPEDPLAAPPTARAKPRPRP